MTSLDARLKKSRKDAGLSQDDLAAKARVSQSLIGNLESKNQKSTSKIAQIAAALDVNALWLATGRGDPRPISNQVNETSRGYDVLTQEETAMLETYRHLTKKQRNELLRSAAETRQDNASILAELSEKRPNGGDGRGD